MSLINYQNLPKQKIWEGIIGAIHHSDKATMAYVYIEEGIQLPEHSHHNEQWSHVIEGTFEFTLNGKVITVSAGMSLHIPSNAPHSGRAITQCKIIDCFIPVREEWKDLPFVE